MGLQRQLAKKIERIYCEDALKFIYTQSEKHNLASLKGLKGVLGLSEAEILNIVRILEQLKLVELKPEGLSLSSQGQEVALQIIRAHRLWETYLSWETDISFSDLHKYAERKEHDLTRSDLDKLDAHLGYPDVDPHGDPIPNRDGYVARQPVVTLSDLDVGDIAKIIHLEDEPEAVFKKLSAYGFRVHTLIEVRDRQDGKVIVHYEGRDLALDTIEANQIDVHLLTEKPAFPKQTLADLPRGKQARVLDLSEQLQGLTRRRLLDLGITPGAKIRNEMPSSFGGDPTMYVIRGTKVALRKDQAKLIYITPLNEPGGVMYGNHN
ncbi:MAG: hypothetical protein D6675_01810 [Gemmatimonadetes bacterium]|nr:MAG: hypothetical protein D6675_01810 [Gemmatimonadota bacterium]